MPDIVYCDNKDCICYDDYYERCDAYRLVIERGVCTGSPRHGRNVSENDLDEQLKAENAKLRELVNSYADLFEKEAAANNGHGPYYSGEDWLALANDMRIELAKCCGELGIEVS